MKKCGKIGFVFMALLIIAFAILAVKGVLEEVGYSIPTESKKNTLTLTSNGCCFWVENLSVVMVTEDGSITSIASLEKLYEGDIFDHVLPDTGKEEVEIRLRCNAYYGEDKVFDSMIYRGNLNQLKESGILLYFQESDDIYISMLY